ncbi:uncharacterized protein N7484_005233 [Penicillium longicatenatum]|uniref:uncharacterized protein n=1 Tax=Penicillium longicatenatum TaxID=1561947 RepID=UPI0025467596|nr:uncharacterized protein N7484_005233 [Penicillium longicatenatum]KAJ5651510.1 hypothetical protein N7484_005233 [Penicillium longicatenatum]KAJ5670911.1 hypothetical protein N7507_000038 [Penicillium longicatenatum]
MQFITIIIATMAAVAAASPYPDAFEKRTCVGHYKVACQSNGPSCCDDWQCVGATEWNDGVCIPNY